MKPGKIDKTAVCHELDLAAEKFEALGYKDLAAKVDYYSSRLRSASENDTSKIYRAIARVQAEYTKRANADTTPDKEKKAVHATRQARRTSDRRNVVLARRLKDKESEIKKANQEIDRLKNLLKIARKRMVSKSATPKDSVDKPVEVSAGKRAAARKARIRARRNKA